MFFTTDISAFKCGKYILFLKLLNSYLYLFVIKFNQQQEAGVLCYEY